MSSDLSILIQQEDSLELINLLKRGLAPVHVLGPVIHQNRFDLLTRILRFSVIPEDILHTCLDANQTDIYLYLWQEMFLRGQVLLPTRLTLERLIRSDQQRILNCLEGYLRENKLIQPEHFALVVDPPNPRMLEYLLTFRKDIPFHVLQDLVNQSDHKMTRLLSKYEVPISDRQCQILEELFSLETFHEQD